MASTAPQSRAFRARGKPRVLMRLQVGRSGRVPYYRTKTGRVAYLNPRQYANWVRGDYATDPFCAGPLCIGPDALVEGIQETVKRDVERLDRVRNVRANQVSPQQDVPPGLVKAEPFGGLAGPEIGSDLGLTIEDVTMEDPFDRYQSAIVAKAPRASSSRSSSRPRSRHVSDRADGADSSSANAPTTRTPKSASPETRAKVDRLRRKAIRRPRRPPAATSNTP